MNEIGLTKMFKTLKMNRSKSQWVPRWFIIHFRIKQQYVHESKNVARGNY